MVTLLGASVTSAVAVPHKGKQVVFINLFYETEMRPARIFFTANSGPYLRNLKWTNWGKARATAHGRYISDCASCGPKRNVKATVKFSKLKYCRTLDKYFYAKALLFRKPREGQDNPARISGGSCPPPGEVDRR